MGAGSGAGRREGGGPGGAGRAAQQRGAGGARAGGPGAAPAAPPHEWPGAAPAAQPHERRLRPPRSCHLAGPTGRGVDMTMSASCRAWDFFSARREAWVCRGAGGEEKGADMRCEESRASLHHYLMKTVLPSPLSLSLLLPPPQCSPLHDIHAPRIQDNGKEKGREGRKGRSLLLSPFPSFRILRSSIPTSPLSLCVSVCLSVSLTAARLRSSPRRWTRRCQRARPPAARGGGGHHL